MKRWVKFLVYCGFLTGASKAQVNLVPNYSFEYYDTCPLQEDVIHYASGWFKCSSETVPTNTTPDYYNSCSPETLFGVPNSIVCYQQEYRGCGAYAGIATYTLLPNYREHIGIQLTQPLVIGQKYYLSFRTVMGEDLIQGYQFGMPSNNVGMRLSTIAYNPTSPVPIDNFAHLYSPSVITDSTNWVRISGSFIADSAYQFVILGNFFTDSATDTLNYNCANCYNAESYYLLDDVCISTDSALCNNTIDMLPCIMSVTDTTTYHSGIQIFPNPSNDRLHIEFESNSFHNGIILDAMGNQVMTFSGVGDIALDIASLSGGIYFVHSVGPEDGRSSSKFVKP